MQEKEEKERPYIREKIVRPPMSKKEIAGRWVVRVVGAAVVGCVFGGTFTLGSQMASRYMTRRLQKDDTTENTTERMTETIIDTAGNTVDETEDTLEDIAESMFLEDSSEEQMEMTVQETIAPSSGAVETMQVGQNTTMSETVEHASETLGVEEYQQLNRSLFEVYENVSDSFVTVYLMQEDVDWLNEPIENKGETFGAILDVNEQRVLIATSYSQIKGADTLEVELNDILLPASVWAKDELTDICALYVNIENVELDMMPTPIAFAENYFAKAGEPVILAGNPMGFSGSVVFANLTYVKRSVSIADGACRILYTDQNTVEGGGGVILNIDGKVIGWISDNYKSSNLQEFVAGIGTSYLEGVLKHLIENTDMALLGTTVMELSKVRDSGGNIEEDMKGLYVTQVLENSPAYNAGIQRGDILQKVGDTDTNYISSLEALLEKSHPGDKVTVVVSRKGRDGYKPLSFEIELGKR